MTVVIAIDSFKGCLTSAELNAAAAKGIRAGCPRATIRTCPVADGGEGTVAALAAAGGRQCTVRVPDPLGRAITASYARRGTLAILECAAASGLPLLAPAERDPRRASSVGTGELIVHALQHGCTDFLIGIGGSATCDGGLGVLAALGYRFRDAKGRVLAPIGASLNQVESIEFPPQPLSPRIRFRIACDVDNPLYGPHGAARVFAPQKGADAAATRELDRGLRHFAAIARKTLGRDIARLPGAGAAGGLGAAFAGFLHAELRPGIELVLDALHFEKLLKGADWVLTGEGRLDAQSAAGKTPVGIAHAAKEFRIPVIAVAGDIAPDADALYACGIDAMFSLAPGPLTLAESMDPHTAARNLTRLARSLASFSRHRS